MAGTSIGTQSTAVAAAVAGANPAALPGRQGDPAAQAAQALADAKTHLTAFRDTELRVANEFLGRQPDPNDPQKNKNLGGARGELARLETERRDRSLSLYPPSWFSGGLRDSLDQQIAAQKEYVGLCEKKQSELDTRLKTAQEVTAAAEAAMKQAQKFQTAGDTAAANEAFKLAHSLSASVGAVLEMNSSNFNLVSGKLKVATEAVAEGTRAGVPNAVSRSNFARASEQALLTQAVVANWQRDIDPATGSPRRVSTHANTKTLVQKLNAANQTITEHIQGLDTLESGIKIGVGITVAVVAVAASGPIGAAFLAGYIGAGAAAAVAWGLGIGVGIAAGSLVGAVAAYGEAAGQMAYGKTWAEVGDHAHSEFVSHVKSSIASVAFGKVFQLVGGAVGVIEGAISKIPAVGRLGGAWVQSLLRGPWTGFANVFPPAARFLSTVGGWLGSGISYAGSMLAPLFGMLSRPLSAAIVAGTPIAAISMYNGAAIREQRRLDFMELIKDRPEFDPKKHPKEYYAAYEKYCEAYDVGVRQITEKSLQNAAVASVAAMLHLKPGPQITTGTWSQILKQMGIRWGTEAGKQTVSVGVGAGWEIVRDGDVEGSDLARLGLCSAAGTMSGNGQGAMFDRTGNAIERGVNRGIERLSLPRITPP